MEEKQSVMSSAAEPNGLAAIAESLAPSDREGRIRVALGLARGPLPKMGIPWLHNYHEYLAVRLSLPFQARCAEGIGRLGQFACVVEVIALLNPDETHDIECVGLVCTARCGNQTAELPLVDLEVEAASPNYQPLEDYWYWVWNWRFDPRI
jgi:hypothetical protein